MSNYYDSIPETTRYSLDMYANEGQQVGHFLTAVLTNNLVEAVSHADEGNIANIQKIVKYMYNKMPAECWGNKEDVDAWIKKGGKKGRKNVV